MQRREFIKRTSVGATALAAKEMWEHFTPSETLANVRGGGLDIEEAVEMIELGKVKNVMPEIRSEITNNPRAVFLIETHVSARPDSRGFFEEARPQMEETGKEIAKSIFVKGSKKGGSTLIKPNFTHCPDDVWSPISGVITSPDFIAGFVESLREMGNTNTVVSERGGTTPNHRGTGIYSVLDKKDIPLIEASYANFKYYRKDELNWHKVPDPVVWKNIPTYRPVGDKDNLFINMPKLKNHNLGLTTLSIKNLQGAVPLGYGQYCWSWESIPFLAKKEDNINFKRDFATDYQERVEAAFLKHRAAGFKYWDYEQSYPKYEAKGGWEAFKKIKDDNKAVGEFMKGIPRLMWDEQWCQRALDSHSALPQSLNIIEGVIGRDGSGFNTGTDQLCNIVIVGLSRPEVDTVGSYVMGQNAKELYYTRIAKERGMGEDDPEKIDIFWIKNDEVVPVKRLAEIKQYKLGVNIHTWSETGERLFW
ncbi:MAG: DUF362 domain-containing protein [Candidatus Latescibacteria bacterium]|nr:DUF362 domain-containing protein [Candidatus Latescibacterota bacterium]